LKNTTLLWKWTATDLAKGIRTRKISSRETVLSCLNRIQEVNPKLNALVEVCANEVLAAADAADKAVKSGVQIGPLHGVPVCTKINTDITGYATSNGVVAYKDEIAISDSPQVASLRKAGAVFIGRSNAPAFSYRWFADNDLHGKTFNPWDYTRTPGGSTGGGAVAVASGMVPIAQGNDIGGSIRHPSFCCGIHGIRPTVGRVAGWFGPQKMDQSLCAQIMLVEGSLARSIADLRLSMGTMSVYDPRCPVYAPAPLYGEPLRRPIKVGLLRDVGVAKPTPGVNKALDDAAEKLRDTGYIVEEVELPLFAEAAKLWSLLTLEEFRVNIPIIEEVGDKGMKLAAQYYYSIAEELWGPTPNIQTYMKGYDRRGTLISKLEQFMQDYPLLLLPVSAEQAFEQNLDISSIDGMRRCMEAQWPMISVPILGFPAIAVSTGVVDGLPVGVQILGRRFREDTIFDAAEILEAHATVETPIDPKF
jgi:amidase